MDINYSVFFPLKEYYEKVVMPIDKKFRVTKADKFICCLHDDKDPSMGIIKSKKKGEIFHCFGCNSWGTVIDLHRKVSLKYFNKRLDDEAVKRELCAIFGVDYGLLPKEEYSLENSKDKEIRKELAMRDALSRFDIHDFRSKFIEGKMENKGIGYYNTLLVNMIVSEKSRED